jgi:hypothetical protein
MLAMMEVLAVGVLAESMLYESSNVKRRCDERAGKGLCKCVGGNAAPADGAEG